MSSPLHTYIKLTFFQGSYIRVTCVACVAWRSMSGLRASHVFAWRSVPAVRCARVLQQQLPPTAVYTVTHTHIRTHFLIMASDPPRQMLLFTLQRTTYEHPLGDIRRHVTAGRALSNRRLTTPMCNPRRKPASLSLYGAARAR